MKLFNKYKKYKRILLYDTENVGFPPCNIPSNILVFLFVSSFNYKSNLIDYPDNYRVIELGDSYNHTKNAMDFCLVAKIATLLAATDTNQELCIISHDKGFDDALQFLLTSYPTRQMGRYDNYEAALNMQEPITNILERHPKDIVDRITKYKICEKVAEHQSMKELKRYINFNTYIKVFTIRKFKNLIVEYDFYNSEYILYHIGFDNRMELIHKENDRKTIIKSFEDECLKRFHVSVISSSDCLTL